MSRPKPTVLHEHINQQTGKTEQVLKADGIFIVVYDGSPINLKTFNAYSDTMGTKYKKTMFPSKAHAHNLASRMNILYNTDKFTVMDVVNGSTEHGE